MKRKKREKPALRSEGCGKGGAPVLTGIIRMSPLVDMNMGYKSDEQLFDGDEGN